MVVKSSTNILNSTISSIHFGRVKAGSIPLELCVTNKSTQRTRKQSFWVKVPAIDPNSEEFEKSLRPGYKRKISFTPEQLTKIKHLVYNNVAAGEYGLNVDVELFKISNRERILPAHAGIARTLRDTQKNAIHYLQKRGSGMLNAVMGAGKTRIVFGLIETIPDVRKVLVIAPLSVVFDVWPRQAETYNLCNGKIVIAPYVGEVERNSKKLRNTLVMRDPSAAKLMVILNYQSYWRPGFRKILQSQIWDLVVYDECHRIRTPKSKQGQFARDYLFNNARMVVGLTGTPFYSKLTDIWGQVKAIRPNLVKETFSAFRDEHSINTETYVNGKKIKVEEKYNAQSPEHQKCADGVMERFEDAVFTITKKDINLKDPIEDVRYVTLEPRAREHYNSMYKEMITYITREENVALIGQNVLVRNLRLQQITSGVVGHQSLQQNEPIIDEDTMVHLSNAKAEAVKDIIDDTNNEPIVVFCKFTAELLKLQVMAEELNRPYFEISGRVTGKSRSVELDNWRASSNGILGAQIKSGSEGLDLTHSDRCIFWSVGSSLGEIQQAMARVHRPPKQRCAQIIHILAENTIDTVQYNAYRDNANMVEHIINYWRAQAERENA